MYTTVQSFNFLYATLSGGTLLQSVITTEQLSNGYHILLFMKINFPPTFILTNVGMLYRPKMVVHAFMIEPDQPEYWYPRKTHNICENLK